MPLKMIEDLYGDIKKIFYQCIMILLLCRIGMEAIFDILVDLCA